jgi:hypothetical protein
MGADEVATLDAPTKWREIRGEPVPGPPFLMRMRVWVGSARKLFETKKTRRGQLS